MINLRNMGALALAGSLLTTEEKFEDIRYKVREPRKPSGKNRDKVKAARRQKQKTGKR